MRASLDWFSFDFDWLRKGRELFFNQTQRIVMQNSNKLKLLRTLKRKSLDFNTYSVYNCQLLPTHEIQDLFCFLVAPNFRRIPVVLFILRRILQALSFICECIISCTFFSNHFVFVLLSDVFCR